MSHTQHKVAGVSVDLQLLHVAGADCGGAMADAWLAYRPGHHGRPASGQAGTIYDRVRALYVRLGRRVRPEDLAAPAEHEATAEVRRRHAALEQRRIAATPPTLPPGPPPIKACNGCGEQVALGAGPVPGTLQAKCDCGRTSTVEVQPVRARRARRVPLRVVTLPPPPRPTDAERQRIRRELDRWQLRVRALQALLALWGDA